MANTVPVVVTVTGTASASGNNDFAFVGGTQLDKMWHTYSARAQNAGWGVGDLAPMSRTLLTSAANLRVIKGNADDEIFTAYVMCHAPSDDIEVERLHPDMTGFDQNVFASSIADVGQNCTHPIYHGHTFDAAGTAQTWAACAMQMKPGSDGSFFNVRLERFDDGGGGEIEFLCEVEYLNWNNADIAAIGVNISTTGAVTDQAIGGPWDVTRTWSLFTFKLNEANADGVHLCDGKIIAGGTQFRVTQQTHTGAAVGTAIIIGDIGATPYWSVIAPLSLNMSGVASSDTENLGTTFDLTRACLAPCAQIGSYASGVCQAGSGLDMAAMEIDFSDADNVRGRRSTTTQAAQLSYNVNAIEFQDAVPPSPSIRRNRPAFLSERWRREPRRFS